MQNIQNSITDDEIKKKFTELRQELGDKLKYTVDELCEIYYELYKNGYTINGFLGSGAEGPVFSVINNGNQIAVKVISSKDASKIENELKIMEKFMNQPYIHQYIRSFYSENKKYLFYLTEKLTCDLESIMLAMKDDKKSKKFSYNQIIAFAIQMTTALSILESNKVIHSDLKPANILYDQINKSFKISDYGFSKIIIQLQSQMKSATKNINGCTLKYTAPEIWKQNSDYTCKIDIFSLGLILLELIYGELSVFEAMAIQTGAASISNYLNKQHGSLNEIISQMLVVDRSNRISASDLLQKLKSLQSEQESRLYKDISGYLRIRVDEITLQNMEQSLKQLKQIYSSSLTQINIDQIKDITRQIKFDQPLKKVNQIMNQQPFQVQQQPQLSYQLNNYFSGTNGYQQQNNFMPQQQQQWQQQQQQKYQQPQYSYQQFQQFSSNQLNNYNQLQYQQQSNSNAYGYQQQNYQQSSYTQAIQQQLVVQNKYPQQYQQQFNQQQIIQPILKTQHKQLKFKNIETVKQLTEVDEALAKYQNDSSVSLDVELKFNGYDNELTELGPSVVASRLASGLEKCSLSITSLSLKFSSLRIGPEGVKSISQSIGMMHQNLLVVGLEFGSSDIGSDEIKYLSSSLEKCDKMTTLGLWLQGDSSSGDNNKIGPTGASHIASSLPKCKSLTELTLSLCWCDIKTKGLQSLGSGLEKCEKLTRLNAAIKYDTLNVAIEYDTLNEQEFGSSLARCPNLITLSVHFVQCQWFLSYAITPSLPLFAKLMTLTLLLDWGDSKNIQTLQTNLKECSNLASLCLEIYNWNLDNTSSLVECLEKSNLTTLKLIFNQYRFGDQAQQQQQNRLGESLSKFKRLTSLYLFFYNCENNPTQFIATLLSNHLAQNKNITTLSLGAFGYYDSGKLTSSDSKMIGESLEKCKYLKTLNLYLWGNEIRSEGALAISQSLSKCVHLTALELSIIESYCCGSWKHEHIYQMDSVSSTITNDLKEKCKNLEKLKVKVRSKNGYANFYRKMLIKLGILTPFESNFWIY